MGHNTDSEAVLGITSVACQQGGPKGDADLPPILCLGVLCADPSRSLSLPWWLKVPLASRPPSPDRRGQTSGPRSFCLAPACTTDVYQLVLCCSDHSFWLWGN